MFTKNILETEEEIRKLRSYMYEPEYNDQIFFNQKRETDLVQKIRDNQEYIDSIYKRMGMEPLSPVYSIKLGHEEEKQEGEEDKEESNNGNLEDGPLV